MRLRFLIIWIILSSLIAGCQNKSSEDTSSLPEKISEPIKELIEKTPVKKEKPIISYSPLAYKDSDSGRAYFKEHYQEDEKFIIYALNRVDAKNVYRVDTLIIPDQFGDWLIYSPFPEEVAILKDVEKFVVFSYPIQAFAAYENGQLLRWGPTSLGSKAHPTPTGLHFSNWKSKKSISTVKDEWILPWNFNIANFQGVGWHEYDLPGYPASHSCLRLLTEDAQWLYQFADQWILKNNQQKLADGTPVIVFGAYPWGERRPWKNQLENPKHNWISEEELTAEINPFIEEILEKQNQRKEVLANR